MRNSEYWKLCFERLEEEQNKLAEISRREIEGLYRQAVREIEGKIDTWYRKPWADGVSMSEALKPLSDAELRKFERDVNDYIRYGRKNALSVRWIKQLENFSARLSVSEYDALRVRTRQSIEGLFAEQSGIVSETMKKIYQRGYYHTAFEVQKGFGVGRNISGIKQDRLEKVITEPWAADGKSFSERISRNKQRLISEVDDELSKKIISKAEPARTVDAVADKLNAYKSGVGRLVMTEGAYFGSAALRDCFEELGVEEYEIIAALDKHTSEVCRGHDGKRFPVKEFRVGVTAPPFHPWCRSAVCPCFDEGFGERLGGCRIAEDISYGDWVERFVGGEG